MQAVHDASAAIALVDQLAPEADFHSAPETDFSLPQNRTLAESIAELNFIVRHQPRIAAGVLAYWLQQR
jgi:hypothetical protein